jgi:transposase-like protein
MRYQTLAVAALLTLVEESRTLCPACGSTNVTMGACAIGSMTVHQEYLCEDCQYEFTGLFALTGFYAGHPET